MMLVVLDVVFCNSKLLLICGNCDLTFESTDEESLLISALISVHTFLPLAAFLELVGFYIKMFDYCIISVSLSSSFFFSCTFISNWLSKLPKPVIWYASFFACDFVTADLWKATFYKSDSWFLTVWYWGDPLVVFGIANLNLISRFLLTGIDLFSFGRTEFLFVFIICCCFDVFFELKCEGEGKNLTISISFGMLFCLNDCIFILLCKIIKL